MKIKCIFARGLPHDDPTRTFATGPARKTAWDAPNRRLSFSSAADYYGAQLAAVVLTGMGKDGTAGLRQIQTAGGYTIVQDKETCTVFGMPRYAIEQGVVDEVLPLQDIEAKIAQMVG